MRESMKSERPIMRNLIASLVAIGTTVLITESEPEILTWPEKMPSSLKVS